MKTIQRPTFNKAHTFERKAALEKWNKFVELLESSTLVTKNKSELGKEIFIVIEGKIKQILSCILILVSMVILLM